MLDMLSKPPAITTLFWPVCTDCAAIIRVFMPEAHTLLTVVQGTDQGRPAFMVAWRAGACRKHHHLGSNFCLTHQAWRQFIIAVI